MVVQSVDVLVVNLVSCLVAMKVALLVMCLAYWKGEIQVAAMDDL